MNDKSVILGLSGGVDSAASAALLKNDGYKVTGAFCIMHDNALASLKDAEQVAKSIGIDFITLDLRDEFKQFVIEPFVNSYINGRTPNPCIGCNPTIKFNALLKAADKAGALNIATGHYAGVRYIEESGRYCITISTSGKDQSYTLYRLTQEQLKRIVFPLYNRSKTDIREIARQYGIPVADKRDSQEICFINGDYNEYIEKSLNRRIPEGRFILEESGQTVGTHKGITGYTIGQRKGLGLSMGVPVFVTRIDTDNNNVYISKTDPLFKELFCNDIVWQGIDDLKEPLPVTVKIRYTAKQAKAVISKYEKLIRVSFDEPQRAVTPGQSAVFYKNDIVLGGGVIL